MTDILNQLNDRLGRMEAALDRLVKERTVKEWYSTAEIAELVGKAEYTVREWCRRKRIHATKKSYSRGAHPEWLIGHAEFVRFRSEGLLPIPALEGDS